MPLPLARYLRYQRIFMPTAEVCAAAARIVHDVTEKGRSLEAATTSHLPKGDAHRIREIREIAWGAVRWWFQ